MGDNTMKRMEFNEGQVVFSQGDPSDRCYKVISGAVRIRISSYDSNGVLHNVNAQTMRHGDVFGEMGIIDDSPRSASAVATEDTVCAAYTADEMMDLLESNPKEALAYIRTLIRRLRSNNIKILIDDDNP